MDRIQKIWRCSNNSEIVFAVVWFAVCNLYSLTDSSLPLRSFSVCVYRWFSFWAEASETWYSARLCSWSHSVLSLYQWTPESSGECRSPHVCWRCSAISVFSSWTYRWGGGAENERRICFKYLGRLSDSRWTWMLFVWTFCWKVLRFHILQQFWTSAWSWTNGCCLGNMRG